MPVSIPVPARSPGDLLTSALWNAQVKDNINKLLDRGHRVLTVAQFAALTGLEGTKGTVAPDEVYLEVDSANGIQWHLAYESGETTYKWRYLGGPALYSEVVAQENVTSVTYVALATAGPSVALPRGGDYDVEIRSGLTASARGNPTAHSYDIGGTGAVDGDCLWLGTGAFDTPAGVRTRRKTALATATLTSKYRSDGVTASSIHNRSMSVTPVRIRHDA